MEIEFLEDTHEYLVDGVLTPSVTSIISKYVLPRKYDNVPKSILEQAAAYGTAIHSAIEEFENGNMPHLTGFQAIGFGNYRKLKDEIGFVPGRQEQVTAFGNLYAGKYDMLAQRMGKTYLVDIKTTSKLDNKYLAWQLGMYKMAIESNENITIDKCACIWLPKTGNGKFVEIEPVSKDEIIEMLEKYEREKEEEFDY